MTRKKCIQSVQELQLLPHNQRITQDHQSSFHLEVETNSNETSQLNATESFEKLVRNETKVSNIIAYASL